MEAGNKAEPLTDSGCWIENTAVPVFMWIWAQIHSICMVRTTTSWEFSFKLDSGRQEHKSLRNSHLVPAIKNFQSLSPKEGELLSRNHKSIRQQSIMSDCQQIDSNSHGLTYLTWHILKKQKRKRKLWEEQKTVKSDLTWEGFESSNGMSGNSKNYNWNIKFNKCSEVVALNLKRRNPSIGEGKNKPSIFIQMKTSQCSESSKLLLMQQCG